MIIHFNNILKTHKKTNNLGVYSTIIRITIYPHNKIKTYG